MVDRKRTYLELLAESEKLRQQAEELKQEEVRNVIEEIKAQIRVYGITAQDLGLTKGRAAKPSRRSYVQIKYSGPNGEQWSGRGLTPKWLKEEIANGKSKEDFAVK